MRILPLWFAALACLAFPLTARASHTVAIVSGEGAAYDQAAEAVEAHLAEAMPDVSIELLRLADQPLADVIDRLRFSSPSLIVTLGELATERIARELPEVPLVCGMVLGEAAIRSRPNATGVFLEFPVSLQLEWLRKFFPAARRVGVLYDPSTNAERVRKAKRVARDLGLELIAREVDRPERLPAALRALSNQIDVLWGMADRLVLSPASAKSVLTFSFANRIPFTGLSSSWVKAGAVYALDRDYEDIGHQCGELARRALTGVSVKDIRPQSPRRVVYTVNLRAIRHMKLELTTALVGGALKTYE